MDTKNHHLLGGPGLVFLFLWACFGLPLPLLWFLTSLLWKLLQAFLLVWRNSLHRLLRGGSSFGLPFPGLVRKFSLLISAEELSSRRSPLFVSTEIPQPNATAKNQHQLLLQKEFRLKNHQKALSKLLFGLMKPPCSLFYHIFCVTLWKWINQIKQNSPHRQNQPPYDFRPNN